MVRARKFVGATEGFPRVVVVVARGLRLPSEQCRKMAESNSKKEAPASASAAAGKDQLGAVRLRGVMRSAAT